VKLNPRVKGLVPDRYGGGTSHLFEGRACRSPSFHQLSHASALWVQVMLAASASVAVKQAVAERLEKPSRPPTGEKATANSRPMRVVGTQAPSSRRPSRLSSNLSGSFRCTSPIDLRSFVPCFLASL